MSKWLSDPTAWGTVVAAVALILSQLPPILVLIRRSRVKLSFPDRLAMQHYLGNVHFLVLVTLENFGARKLTVAKLDGLLLTPWGAALPLPGQQYISRQPPTSGGQGSPELLLVGVTLKPDEAWSESVRFFESVSEDEEDHVNRIAGGMRKNIWQKQLANQNPGIYEADAPFVAEASEFFGQRFHLTKGNYTFIIAARDAKGQVLAVQGAEFTLYENSISTFREATEEYKYGNGVCFPSRFAANVLPRPRPIPEEQARSLFEKKFPS